MTSPGADPSAEPAPALDAEVAAAGGVVVRPGPEGPEVLVVHRPRYDDWSFPKGKLEAGEDFLTGALREILEETGMEVAPGDALAEVRYRDRRGRSKVVRYWQMSVIGGDFTANDEVDRAEWLSVPDAVRRLSYPHDRALIGHLRDT